MDGMSRRAFLGALGSGMLAGAVGLSLAEDLGMRGLGQSEGEPIDFGKLEPLVAMMQDVEADSLLPMLGVELDKGASLSTLVAAGALANARAFGGQDYVGYHCYMALLPSLAMARRLPKDEAALPVLKVLHRNTARIQQQGGRKKEVLRTVKTPETSDPKAAAAMLTAGRTGDFPGAETALADLTRQDKLQAFHSLQPLVRDNVDVHQVVLAWRAWDMLRVAGKDTAYVLMRSALRQCIDRDNARRARGRAEQSLRKLLPALMDEHGLTKTTGGTSTLESKDFEALVDIVFKGGRDVAAKAVAAALAKGVSSDQIGEVISTAGVNLLLHDRGSKHEQPKKPVGTVHGASVGVHAADAADAWRGIASVTSSAEANASLIAGAWHTAGQGGRVDTDKPFHVAAREEAAKVAADKILDALREAVAGREQKMAAALVERYGALGNEPAPVIDALLPYAVSQEGALHHEKYFATATTEFARTRPTHRWKHLAALARVNASGFGFDSHGYKVARDLLPK